MRRELIWVTVVLCSGIGLVPLVIPPQAFSAEEKVKYALGPDSQRKPNVPKGIVTKAQWKSEILEGTTREYSVYVPAQYKSGQPTALMVFQDGHTYADENGQFRVPVVLDNLIHMGDLPPIIAIFINPGHKGGGLPESPWKANNRSVEYDTLSDQYARFLIHEILPEVGKTYTLTDDPDQRAICGISSGGICAFTVAWEKPDSFRKVMSHIGSFTNIRGGHDYEARIRKTPPKPLRVFLQDGSNDVNNEHGNWWLANLQMESALKYKNYDVKFIGGEGEHNGEHGGAILPDSLRWLWRTKEIDPFEQGGRPNEGQSTATKSTGAKKPAPKKKAGSR
jgi:enterochelin esterase-like enzyme